MSKSHCQRARGVDWSPLLTVAVQHKPSLLWLHADKAIQNREAVSKDIIVSSCRHLCPFIRQTDSWNSTPSEHDGERSAGSKAWVPMCSACARLSEHLPGSRRSCKSSSPRFLLQDSLSQFCPSFLECLYAFFFSSPYAVAKPWVGSHPIRFSSHQISKTVGQVPCLC